MPQFDTKFFPSLVFWSVVSFALMLLIVAKYLYPSLTRILEERRKKVSSDLEAARANREEAERLLAEQRALLEKARAQSDAMIRQAEEMARTLREEREKELALSVKAELDKASAQIAADREKMKADLRNETVTIIVRSLETLLEESLSDTQKVLYINKAMKALDERKAG
ncbi:MAG: F0F1 ATP synthase subunit B [Nitrospirae bacterium]|nr:F0F1 ATP synthase subunit B [Nitrospirota bacterium]MCL5285844.1 F0F1 ATP synthase subunit B [Nitrospirota bacterium]